MGKIGSYEYPEISIGEAVKIAGILVNDFHKKVNDVNVFANRVGHKSASSGTFLVKIGDIRRYGIMEKRDYQATKRAEILANPKSPKEKDQEIREMILGVPLFEKLKSRLKTKSPTIEQFKTQLIEITGNREKGSKEAEKIRKVYIDTISHIKEGVKSSQENEDFFDMEDSENENSKDVIYLRAGKTKLVLPLNDNNIKLIKGALTNMMENPDED